MTLKGQGEDDDFTMPMCGYRGVRSFLYPQALRVQATRPSERVFKHQCSDAQWAVIERHQQSWVHVQERQRTHAATSDAGGARGVDHSPSRSGQQTLHPYGSSDPPLPYPTSGRTRPRNPESAAQWSYHHRPTEVGDIVFDLDTMTPTLPTYSQIFIFPRRMVRVEPDGDTSPRLVHCHLRRLELAPILGAAVDSCHWSCRASGEVIHK